MSGRFIDNPVVQDSQDSSTETIVQHIETLKNVDLKVSVIMGESNIPVKSLLSLKRNSIVELDRNQNDDVDIYVNQRLIAKGQIVAIDDEYAVSITRIIEPIYQDGSMEKELNE